jgi:hypothetical protein
MPRCQRTFHRLGPGETAPGSGDARWVCSFCEDREAYATVRDPDLLHYASLAEATCHHDFGKPSDHQRPTLFLSGLRPECVLEPQERRYEIYLQQGSDPYQVRLQIGHEVFHRTCSQGHIFHWTHEMLACLVSVRLLRRNGWSEYATLIEEQYARQADQITFAEMVAADLSRTPYPAGLYGRAYVTGAALGEGVGWHSLCRLARCLDHRGTPDIAAWQACLPLATAPRVVALLQNAGELVYPSVNSGN